MLLLIFHISYFLGRDKGVLSRYTIIFFKKRTHYGYDVKCFSSSKFLAR